MSPEAHPRDRVVSFQSISRVLSAYLACLALLIVAAGGVFVALPVPRAAAAASSAQPSLSFPGPSSGVPGTQTPTAANFVQHGSVCVSPNVFHVSGTAIVTGTTVLGSGCPEMVLYIAVPGKGSFLASVAQADESPTSTNGGVAVRVVGADGYTLRSSTVAVNSASNLQSLSIDVSGGVAVVLDALGGSTLLYNLKLSGTARALQAPPAASVDGPPAGAQAVNLAAATYVCTAAAATAGITVTLVRLSPHGMATASNCGQMTLHLSPNTAGTFVMRYGMADSVAAGTLDWVYASVLDSAGHTLRQAVGVALPGGGLRPLWLDLRGGRAVLLQVVGSTAGVVAIANAGILPRRLPVYSNPTRLVGGGAPGANSTLDSTAFTSACAITGYYNTTVAHAVISGGSYLSASTSCLSAQLLLDSSKGGSFHALFGIPDAAPAGVQPTVIVTATAADGSVIGHSSARAAFGVPGVPLDISLQRGTKKAAILSFVFTGAGSALYSMHLQAPAIAVAALYPPVDPPVTTAGGTAINPHDFALANTSVLVNDTGDQTLVGDSVLLGWGLVGGSTAEADLVLAGTSYPSHQFSARVGMTPYAPVGSTISLMLKVIGRSGTVVRQATWQVAYGANPQTIHISLAGGVRLQVLWGQVTTGTQAVIYAMTAS